MGTTQPSEIVALEERLRAAELGPDPEPFRELLDDHVVLLAQDGAPISKAMVVQAHEHSSRQKFERVEFEDVQMADHDDVVVVVCRTRYSAARKSFVLKTVRIWKRTDRWRVIAAAMYVVD